MAQQAKTENPDDLVMIRVKRSTRDKLNDLCPKGMKPEYFRDEFIVNSIETTEALRAAEVC